VSFTGASVADEVGTGGGEDLPFGGFLDDRFAKRLVP
jgi:hypothetical protein